MVDGARGNRLSVGKPQPGVEEVPWTMNQWGNVGSSEAPEDLAAVLEAQFRLLSRQGIGDGDADQWRPCTADEIVADGRASRAGRT